MEYKIDAKGKKIGRVAQEAASILMGKNDTSFERNTVSGNKVVIENASLADIPAEKLENKEYKSFSGYPGGLKLEKMKRKIEKHGFGEVFKSAIVGMLPANRIARQMMKNLTIKE